MSFSDNDEDVFIKRQQQPSPLLQKAKMRATPVTTGGNSRYSQRTTPTSTAESRPNTRADSTFSPHISWPILLAVVPTVGSFFAGSADVWSDFVMILLILYYVYKWMTVPWSYYESARSRRMLHQKSSIILDERKQLNEMQRRAVIAEELRRHELVGLFWVIISPFLAGYTLQYSRYFLSNYERYMSSFNVVVFVLAASLKPLAHVMTLLRERTLYLQSEMQTSESQVQSLQRKLELMEDELDTLRKAFATKKDLGQVTDGLNPTIQQLAKTLRRFEKKETVLRSWSEERFSTIEQKVSEFDQFICYRIEQDQRQSAHGMVVTLVLLPLNITLWVAKRMTGLLPVPRALLGHASTTAAKSNVTFHHHHHNNNSSNKRNTGIPTKHLTHPDSELESIIAAKDPAETATVNKSGSEPIMTMNKHRLVQR